MLLHEWLVVGAVAAENQHRKCVISTALNAFKNPCKYHFRSWYQRLKVKCEFLKVDKCEFINSKSNTVFSIQHLFTESLQDFSLQWPSFLA